jgi:hypothetical protein
VVSSIAESARQQLRVASVAGSRLKGLAVPPPPPRGRGTRRQSHLGVWTQLKPLLDACFSTSPFIYNPKGG